MKKRQINGYEAGKRVQGLWTSYALDLNSIAEMAPEKANLDAVLLKIEIASAAQSSDITGNAALKEMLKQEMAGKVVKFAMRGRVKARQAHNISLEQELNQPVTYYTKVEGAEALAKAMATRDKIKSNLLILTNITDDNVVEMDKAIAAFEAMLAVPKADKQTQKVVGTDQIVALNVELDNIIISMGDLIHSYFEDSILSQEFDAKSKLGTSISRHNHVIFHVEAASTHKPIVTAKATNVKTNKTVTADDEGMIEFETVNAGKQAFIIGADGYTDKTVYVLVNRGTTTELVIDLEI